VFYVCVYMYDALDYLSYTSRESREVLLDVVSSLVVVVVEECRHISIGAAITYQTRRN
jgi:hypothetical protein